jgi:hypothetical protein
LPGQRLAYAHALADQGEALGPAAVQDAPPLQEDGVDVAEKEQGPRHHVDQVQLTLAARLRAAQVLEEVPSGAA